MTQAPSAPRLPIDRPTPFDPPTELGRIRADQPISPLSFPDGHIGWLVTGHAEARELLRDPRFSSRQELRHFPIEHSLAKEPAEPARPGMFIRMDAPEHGRLRKLLTGQFTVKRMKALEPRIQGFIDRALDDLEASGRGSDLVSHFALPVPSLVICELLGVPYEDRAFFQKSSKTFLSMKSSAEDIMAAFETMGAYLADLVEKKIAEPTDDILGGLAATGELTAEELANIAFLLLVAGHETTANMLGLGTFALLSNPDQLARLKADPGLADNAVEELLRYLSIIQFGMSRSALEDAEIAGVKISAGQTVILSVAAINRDPEHFPNPDEMDLGRRTNGHLGFGHGVHQCLGQQLARVEMRIGFNTLFERFPDLRLACEPSEVPMKNDTIIYGVHSLAVTW